MKMLRRVLVVLVLVGVLLLTWGLIEPYILDEQRYIVALPNLPAAWSGQQIAVVADFQVGMWLDNTASIRRAVNRLVNARPAAVLIAGDFIYHTEHGEGDVVEAVALTRPLVEADIPTFAVLGNHDYSLDEEGGDKNQTLADALAAALEAAGVEVLVNESAALVRDGDALYIVGLGSHYAQNDDAAAALAGLPTDAPRVVFHHHPDSFRQFPAESAPLAVAGHTHGGQIAVPFTPEWTYHTYIRGDDFHADGWVDEVGASGNRLYINRGIGFSLVPVRFSARPEITYFRLVQE